MNDFKVGDRFSVEGVVTASADREGDYRALFDGHETDSYVIGAEMTHAKLIQPKPRYDWSNIPPEYDWAATDRGGAVYAYINKPFCRDPVNFWISKNSGDMFRLCAGHQITEDWRDSLEQRLEEVEAAVKVAEEKGVDFSKPLLATVRGGTKKLECHYIATDDTDGHIFVRFPDGSITGLFPDEIENIPEPKKTVMQEVNLHEYANGRRFFAYGYVPCAPLISKARITHTSGEGWSIEEVK